MFLKRLASRRVATILAVSLLVSLTSLGATPAEERLSKEVHKALATLPYFGVFDDLGYRINGSTVELYGEVTQPVLKADAEGAVKRIEGVQQVKNNIEVLPVSPMDDAIRIALLRAIYGNPTLNRYGIQANPPIHIIVKNGNVTLKGLVANEFDKNLAGAQARSVPGTFDVKNELRVED